MITREDEKWINEHVTEAPFIKTKQQEYASSCNDNVSVNGNVNGGCKRILNTLLSQSKHGAITELKACNYRTNPAKIAGLLEAIFSDYPSIPGHWFYIAQHWPARRINYVLNDIIRLEHPDYVTVKNPAALFTHLIKYRKRRK